MIALLGFIMVSLHSRQEASSPPEPWVYISNGQITPDVQNAINGRSWQQLVSYVKANVPDLTPIDEKSGGFAFDDSVWQARAIARQTAMYEGLEESLKNHSPLNKTVDDYLQFILSGGGKTVSNRPPPIVALSRYLTFVHENDRLTINLSTPSALDLHLDFRPATNAVVPYGQSDSEPWAVQYPTSYLFFEKLSRDIPLDLKTTTRLRQRAIDLIDSHLDDFMKVRHQKRVDIEFLLDGIQTTGVESELFMDLPKDLQKKILTAAASYTGRQPVHGSVSNFISSATLERIESKLLLKTVDADGAEVLVEIP